MINWGFKIALIGLFFLILSISAYKITAKPNQTESDAQIGWRYFGNTNMALIIIGVIIGIILL